MTHFDQPPSRVRYRVLAMLCLLSFILYLDRICISQAVSLIEADLGISHSAMSYVLGAFTLAYGLFELPIGHWGDRYGSRGVLARIAVWWSVFTMLTGACTGLVSLIVVRFLFGAGEAGGLPNIARVLGRWFPLSERGPAQGLVLTTALVGGALSPIIAEILIQNLGWRGTFAALGIPGIAWAVVFYATFRDDPAEHPRVNDAELTLLPGGRVEPEQHPPVPWSIVLRNANLWLLGAIVSSGSFTTYMIFSWYPTYLKIGRGVEATTASRYAGLVLAAGAIGSLLGGVCCDRLVRYVGRRRVRCTIGAWSLTSGALAMTLGAQFDEPFFGALCTAWACFAIHFQLGGWWGTIMDQSGRHLGALFGLMNSLGIPGAIGSQLFLGHFVDWMARVGYTGREQWDPAYFVYAALLVCGAGCWLAIGADRSLVDPAGLKPLETRPQP